jgi:16S rRNA processing protein RimM
VSDRNANLDDWRWTIGDVVASFGLKGELRVRFQTDFPERFEAVKQVCLRRTDDTARLFDVQGRRFHRGHVLLKLRDIDSIDDAEALRGVLVQVRRADAVPLEDDDFYVEDLKGVAVETADGRRIGVVDDVLAYPAQDLLKVGDVLIPLVRGIVVEVDLRGGRIVIDPPEGMLPGDEQADAD